MGNREHIIECYRKEEFSIIIVGLDGAGKSVSALITTNVARVHLH